MVHLTFGDRAFEHEAEVWAINMQVNLAGTYNVLQAAADAGVRSPPPPTHIFVANRTAATEDDAELPRFVMVFCTSRSAHHALFYASRYCVASR